MTDRSHLSERAVLNLPEPTPEELASPEFEAIWRAIKSWDVNVPGAYVGKTGSNGSHAAVILRALRADPFPGLRPISRIGSEEAVAKAAEETVQCLEDAAVGGLFHCDADREEAVEIVAEGLRTVARLLPIEAEEDEILRRLRAAFDSDSIADKNLALRMAYDALAEQPSAEQEVRR